jgi:peptidoglycan/LPS O-acetylase OafA/YrhL
MFGVIIFYLVIKIFLKLLPENTFILFLRSFWSSVPIDCMAIGGIFALIAYSNNPVTFKIKNILFNRFLQWGVFLITIYFLSTGFKFNNILGYFHYAFYAILFGILIINFACNKKRIFSMENSVFNYLGKISYGLYMFHSIVIVFSIKLCQLYNYENNFILYPLVFVLIILLSSASYEFFEKRFIKMKVKYSDIISGENTKK